MIGRQRHPGAKPRHDNRRGSVVIIAMIALLLASAMGLALVRTSLAERQLVIQSQDRLQAQWLTEAGIERAVVQYHQSPNYNMETWQVPDSLLADGASCTITIKLQAAALNKDSRLVRVSVVTDYTTSDSKQIRDRKSVEIPEVETDP